MPRSLNGFAIVLLSFCLLPWVAFAADWPQFRGPDAAGRSDATGLPTTWGDTNNVVWKTELPGFGASSPVTFGDKI